MFLSSWNLQVEICNQSNPRYRYTEGHRHILEQGVESTDEKQWIYWNGIQKTSSLSVSAERIDPSSALEQRIITGNIGL